MITSFRDSVINF